MENFLYSFSKIWVISSILSSLFILYHIASGHRQSMRIMEAVWPITGLWSGIFGLWAYFKLGRKDELPDIKTKSKKIQMPNGYNSQKKQSMQKDMPGMKMGMPGMKDGKMVMKDGEMPGMDMKEGTMAGMNVKRPFFEKVALSTLHCGAGCSLADLISEWFTFLFPAILLGTGVAGQWTLDYLLALIIGIFFQYAAIQPMLHLKPSKAIARAFKIDFFSLTAWQIGMYGWMAVCLFILFPERLVQNSWVFWFMMQIGMLCGFITSFPVNWLLIKMGIKNGM